MGYPTRKIRDTPPAKKAEGKQLHIFRQKTTSSSDCVVAAFALANIFCLRERCVVFLTCFRETFRKQIKRLNAVDWNGKARKIAIAVFPFSLINGVRGQIQGYVCAIIDLIEIRHKFSLQLSMFFSSRQPLFSTRIPSLFLFFTIIISFLSHSQYINKSGRDFMIYRGKFSSLSFVCGCLTCRCCWLGSAFLLTANHSLHFSPKDGAKSTQQLIDSLRPLNT